MSLGPWNWKIRKRTFRSRLCHVPPYRGFKFEEYTITANHDFRRECSYWNAGIWGVFERKTDSISFPFSIQKTVVMKGFFLGIVFLMISSSAHAQLKPEAMTLPVIFTGISSAEERAIIQSHVINELSVNYDLKSEKEVEQAREVAVDKISSENCTEEACIKQMGELLDVEHTFTFRIIAAGNYWDLSAIRLDLIGTTVRRNIACEQCNLSRARLLLTELIVGLRPGTTTVKRGEAVLQLESEPRSLIFLEGIEQGNTPLVLTVPTDRPAEILAVAEGYQDYSNLFELKSGELRKIKIPLVRRRGSFEITSEPSGASIILDGKQLTSSGGTPCILPPLFVQYMVNTTSR